MLEGHQAGRLVETVRLGVGVVVGAGEPAAVVIGVAQRAGEVILHRDDVRAVVIHLADDALVRPLRGAGVDREGEGGGAGGARGEDVPGGGAAAEEPRGEIDVGARLAHAAVDHQRGGRGGHVGHAQAVGRQVLQPDAGLVAVEELRHLDRVGFGLPQAQGIGAQSVVVRRGGGLAGGYIRGKRVGHLNSLSPSPCHLPVKGEGRGAAISAKSWSPR